MLNAALGACTAMTVRMYADRKKWPLESVRVALVHDKVHASDCAACETEEGRIDRIVRVVELKGDLSEDQRARLLEIADRCPVHRTLHAEVEIVTRAGRALKGAPYKSITQASGTPVWRFVVGQHAGAAGVLGHILQHLAQQAHGRAVQRGKRVGRSGSGARPHANAAHNQTLRRLPADSMYSGLSRWGVRSKPAIRSSSAAWLKSLKRAGRVSYQARAVVWSSVSLKGSQRKTCCR